MRKTPRVCVNGTAGLLVSGCHSGPTFFAKSKYLAVLRFAHAFEHIESFLDGEPSALLHRARFLAGSENGSDNLNRFVACLNLNLFD